MKIPRRKLILSLLVLGCTGILAFLALIQPYVLRPQEYLLQPGDVAPVNMHAPADIQYISEVLTEQARQDAERAVAPVYGAPDPAIGRSQTDLLISLLQQITEIRQVDGDIPYEQKLNELVSMHDLTLSTENASLILNLPVERWDLVRAEAITVLGQVMRSTVRTEDLEKTRQSLDELVSFTLTENEVKLVVDLVSPLVVANSFYSPELTDSARQAARDAVEPVIQSYRAGQVIVLGGQLVTDVTYEALTRNGLIQPAENYHGYLGAGALVSVMTLFILVYYYRRQLLLQTDLRALLLLAALFLVFLFLTRIIIPNRTLVPYLTPIPAFALLVSALFGLERGLVFGLVMSMLAPYGMPDSLALMPYYMLMSLFGVLALGQARRVIHFIYAVAGMAGPGMVVVVAYRWAFTGIDWVGLVSLAGGAIFCAVISSALVLPLLYLLAQFLGVPTPMQLLDISRPDSRLLNYFLQHAPGTYQHSLQVANLAEQAAEAIGADALLVRVGALFHDIGKATDPLFFIENQPPSQINSHDDLPPEESAAHILRHVEEGLQLARKYRLPKRLQDFIREHHGTMITQYQYNRALKNAGGNAQVVDSEKFRYPGPTPRSKETALLMLADGVEARARAEQPASVDEMRALVRSVVENRRNAGQLDEAPLTQRDLTLIIESFVSNLQVTYHPRLDYPRETASATAEQTARRRERKK